QRETPSRSSNRRPLERRGIFPSDEAIQIPSQSLRPILRQKILREKFSAMLRPLRQSPRLGQEMEENPRHLASSLLEMVRRRQTQCLLQLRRSPSRPEQK